MTTNGSRVILSRLKYSGRCRSILSAGAGGSDVRYGLRLWPFTLNCRPVLMLETSTDSPSKNFRIRYGPSHQERSFLRKNLRREL